MKRGYLIVIYSLASLAIFISCHRKPNTPPQGPIISTVAGNGNGGGAPVDGAAATASIINPHSVGTDTQGNIYVMNDNGIVYKINSAGAINRFAGNGTPGFSGDGGPATAAQFGYTSELGIAPSGDAYIADGQNSRLRRINSAGIINTIAGSGTTGYSGDGGPATAANLYGPTSVAIGVSGIVYIGEGYRIRKIDTNGIITTIAGIGIEGNNGDGGEATAARLKRVRAIAADAYGNVYTIDGTTRIRKISSNGIISTIAGNGTAGFSGDGGPATAAQIAIGGNFGAGGIAVGLDRSVYFSDAANLRVRKVNPQGIISTVAGTGYRNDIGMGNYYGGYNGDGLAATAAQLNWPEGIAIDANSNIYIADFFNARVRKVTQQ